MDVMKLINKGKEEKIIKFLVEENWSNFIYIYDEMIEVLESSRINDKDEFPDRLLCNVTSEVINKITSILIKYKEIELFEERNREVINNAVFKALFSEQISPVTNVFIENDKYIVEIFDSTYIPF